MTVPATTRKAGPFTGNGSQTVFPFSFKIFATTDVKVTQADLASVETVLSSGYTVSMNADQVASPGGSVTLAAALTTGYKLSVTGNLPYDQTLALPGGGNFNPTVLENDLDRITMQVQQLNEAISRAVVTSVTSGTDPATLVATLIAAAASASASAASATASLNAFKGQYYGALSADPTLDPLGAAMTAGDIYFNTTTSALRVYSGAVWFNSVQTVGTEQSTATSVAGTNTVTGTIVGVTSYAFGQMFRFVAANTNTGAMTVNWNGIGAVALTKSGSTPLDAGDVSVGATIIVVYDGTRFQLASGAGGGGAKAGGVLYENSTTLTANYTLSTGKNASTVGPLSINTGVTLSVPTGARLVVL
jgi:hypothetical protein